MRGTILVDLEGLAGRQAEPTPRPSRYHEVGDDNSEQTKLDRLDELVLCRPTDDWGHEGENPQDQRADELAISSPVPIR
jgi:hypothetical protein